ncbi:MAG: transposase [Nitrososphaera sp.]
MYAGERLEWAKPGEHLIYHLPKSRPDGQTTFTPLEWLDRMAVLIPPPRRHRQRSHGVLAPNGGGT